MRAFLLVVAVVSMSGCSGLVPLDMRLHVEGGAAFPELGGQSLVTDTDSLRDLHAGIGAVHVEATVLDVLGIAMDVGTGPMVWGSHQGELYGAEVVARIRLKVSDWVEPYVVGTAGFGHAEGWHGSDVHYAYTSGLGIGALFRVTDTLAILGDWRWLHHSNGMTFHSDGFRDMIGQTKATENDGHQNAGVFVGVSWDF